MKSSMLTILINGKRIDVNPCEDNRSITKILTVLEDDEVGFEVCSEGGRQSPSLWIQDLELGQSMKAEQLQGGQIKYSWLPSKIFRNHFGYCQISLVYKLNNDSNEEELRIIFPYVEVLATKVKAESAINMLEYLQQKLKDVIRTCFSGTFWAQGSTNVGFAHPNDIISQAEECIKILEVVFPTIKKRPLSKLRPVQNIRSFEEVKNISEHTISWLCSNPDLLQPSLQEYSNTIKVNNRNYIASHIAVEELEEDIDIYENRVFIGLLRNLKVKLSQINEFYEWQEKKFKEERSDYTLSEGIPLNYQRFASVASRFGIPFCQKQKARSNSLIKRVESLYRQSRNYLNVTGIEEIPKLTPKFRNYPHYRKVFEASFSWYKLGNMNYSGDAFIFGIKSLDLLYEFYCLFRLIECIESAGYTLNEPNSRVVNVFGFDRGPNRHYSFINQYDETIELWYEPQIGMIRSDISDLARLNKRRPLKPDFVIRIDCNSESRYVIFDAKYSTPSITLKYYIPELIYKYLHEIGSRDGGFSPVWFVWAITPSNQESNPYDIFKSLTSERITLPNVGILPMSPGEEDKGSELLKAIIASLEKLLY